MIPQSGVNEFRILAKLGEGSFADVYKVISLNDQKNYAEKRLKKRYRSLEEVNQLAEVSALKMLSKHPNIITLHTLMFDTQSGHVALIFEPMEMNLFEFLAKRETALDEFSVLLIIYQLLKAVRFVHNSGIFHRDIKPENCLINSDTLELKLADFGSVSAISNRTKFTEYIATRWYRAPECILTLGAYGPSVDIWAIGCVLFETLTLKPLFPGKGQLDQLNKIHSILGTPSRDELSHYNNNSQINFVFPQKAQVKQPLEKLLPNASRGIIDLISKMVKYDPNDRISAAEALNHQVFSILRKIDNEYSKIPKKMPFSVFAQINQTKYSSENIEQNLTSENIAPKNVLDNGCQKTGQVSTNYIQGKVVFNTMEARRLAAQRIAEYHKKQLKNTSKIEQKLLPIAKIGSTTLFQKPRLEIIQSRMPLISFRL